MFLANKIVFLQWHITEYTSPFHFSDLEAWSLRTIIISIRSNAATLFILHVLDFWDPRKSSNFFFVYKKPLCWFQRLLKLELGSGALHSFSETPVLPEHLPLYAKHTSFPCSTEGEMHWSREVNKPDWLRADCYRWVLTDLQSYKDQGCCRGQLWTWTHKSDGLTKN